MCSSVLPYVAACCSMQSVSTGCESGLYTALYTALRVTLSALSVRLHLTQHSILHGVHVRWSAVSIEMEYTVCVVVYRVCFVCVVVYVLYVL